ncbi:2-succinyl-5-enolpyruvyl-6-hydroxy-3-cyclohexene-1-carboxylic-acid synthase [Roseivirga misakiensis]|uniref:2-succinyl-5-enolpyruvyl-6-hydroxy-3-cyclohexene-1-carboxylate synthase n=1 Tax=Roseivirga misakiensis TaxID=1563681 RepID=A0A1E5T178_9BACT|nr:2-succinyl-5-enolpyruvyl-6-hydroxy-3-cyclohexene-1-carboxylic-acid synthase [Roseivirga misakiensis]OEK05067.1 2-succinyl-5-enolpyruvyl-6-hydroxy-3-cyclohexene-1-carboxylic-acid synthase [Roseivirga misakiensis]
MILNHINDIASICAGHGIKTAVISPGSRSAPITLAFNQYPDIEVKMVADERSAAFIAIGIAQQQKQPVVLVCTSGSAVYNYAPAVAEAYYQEVPLLILSADRPPEWTNQYDGQTIQQAGIFGNHVKKSFQFPVEGIHKDDVWYANRVTNEAIISAKKSPKGPVHINVPLREPFYPSEDESISFNPNTRIIHSPQVSPGLTEETWASFASVWEKTTKRLVVVGQLEADGALTQVLEEFSKDKDTLVINDVTGNQHTLGGVIQHQDAFLLPDQSDVLSKLTPELLITIGKSLISKNLKLYFRKNPPKHHWHIHESDQVNDTLQHVTNVISTSPNYFIHELNNRTKSRTSKIFNSAWSTIESRAAESRRSFLENCEFGEFQAINLCVNVLPNHGQLHLANSMSVRYANLLGMSKNVKVFANRGTSGIDGSNGTAVGAAIAQQELVTLITGDMAFLYDRNAFWHSERIKNMRIIVLNNSGGGIFRMIKGPRDQKDYEKLFQTDQPLTAKHTALDFGFDYFDCDNRNDLEEHLKDFYSPSDRPKILEVFSDSKKNTEVFEAFKKLFVD